jgi:inorganic triphosphatase YgiF
LFEAGLTLTASREHIKELRQTLEFMGQSQPAVTSVLSATYFDSADFKLLRQGLDLRLRDEGGRKTQILASSRFVNGNSLSVSEVEDAIAGDRPDLEAPETGPRLRDVVLPDELRPLFRTTVQRTTIAIEPQPSTQIEVAIDEGEISGTAGDASEPFCEIELKLKSGDSVAIYDVAARLLDVGLLRIETRSRATRGYRLVAPNGGSIAALHAPPVALHGAVTVESALQSIGRGCISHLLCNEPAFLSGEVEAVHQMRVACRRLRAALSAFRPIIPADQYRWASGELTWLAGELAPARNWDVFAVSILRPVERALPVEVELRRLAEAASQRRRAAYERAKEAIGSRRYTATLLQLARWFEARSWRDQPASERAALLFATIADIAPRLIERRWRRARKRSQHFGRLSPDERHKLRIALKNLRYTIDFFHHLLDGDDVQSLVRRLKPLQDDLGCVNDIRTAHLLVDEVSRHANENGREIARAGGIVLGWHDRGLADREPRLRKDVRRLRRAKPFWPRTGRASFATAEEPLAAPTREGQLVEAENPRAA